MLVAVVVVAVVFNRDATGRGAEINLLCYFIFFDGAPHMRCKATKVLARGAYADLPLLLSGTVRRDTWEGESLWPIGEVLAVGWA